MRLQPTLEFSLNGRDDLYSMNSGDDRIVLPSFELSYGLDRHSKVAPDLFMLAPKGQRVIIAFLSRPDGDSCYICKLDRHSNVCRYTRVLASFSRELCAGTLLYGVIPSLGSCGSNIVLIEDVIHWMGKPVTRDNLVRKCAILEELFQRHLGAAPSTRYLDFALPVWANSLEDARSLSASLGYEARAILGFSSRARGMRPLAATQFQEPVAVSRVPSPMKAQILDQAVLVCKALEAQDSYALFARAERGELVSAGHAAVNTIATSVLLNGIFRRIKENSNLDLLEESDSDDEFECVAPDKYVDLNKSVVMMCSFNSMQAAWAPVSVAPPGEPVSLLRDVKATLAQSRGFSTGSTHGTQKKSKGRGGRRPAAGQLHRAC